MAEENTILSRLQYLLARQEKARIDPDRQYEEKMTVMTNILFQQSSSHPSFSSSTGHSERNTKDKNTNVSKPAIEPFNF